jgi:hypothetical protein
MFKDTSKITMWYVWMITYLCRNVTIVRGVSYHLPGSWISQDLKIRFWLQVESYISDLRLSEFIWLWSVRRPLSEQYKIRWAFFASIDWIQFLPRQGNNSQKWPTATVTVMANRDGNCDGWRWRMLQWPMARATATTTLMADGNATERAAAMVNGARNGNGWRRRQWAMAMAMVMVMESVTTTEMVMAIAMATEMVRVTTTKAGLPLHVPAMCSAMTGATPCLHPHGHNGKCIHQCCVMGVTLLRVFPPFQGGGFLTAHHGLFFSVYWTTLCLPPALFRRSRTLSAHWRSTSSTPPRPPSAYWQSTPALIALFVKVSPDRACNDYNLTFCVDVKWQISQQTSLFPKLLLCHWQITPLSFW